MTQIATSGSAPPGPLQLREPGWAFAPAAPAGEALAATLDRGIGFFLGAQAREGFWWAELEANVTMAAEHLMLEHFLGVGHAGRWAKIARYILNKQQDDGSWAVYFGGPGDLSVTTEAYFSLKLAGTDPSSPAMVRARDWVRANGGVAHTRIFTKLWLSLFGQFDWDVFPAMPPEAILLPPRSPLNIYEFASWARATIVAILVVWAHKPVVPIPPEAAIPELFLEPADRRRLDLRREPGLFGWRNAFIALDRLARLHERLPWKPLRKRALRRCEQWILDHQEADGGWGGIQPPWVYSMIALRCLGYGNGHPVIRRAVDGLLHEFALSWEDEVTIQPCVSPVWDTALAITGLREAGLPADHPALVRAARWMLALEVRVEGDWTVKVKGVEPGGWPFEFANETYPDTDDTAEVLIALRLVDHGLDDGGVVRRANAWLRAMQSSNGGWGAFDKDNTREFLKKLPFCDFGATLDPPTEDVTAHVLEWLLLAGASPADRDVASGLRYLERTQEADGSWWGRWGVNYVYGLGAAVPALIAAGESPRSERIRRAVRWLEEHQNADGGWGETCRSYDEPELRGIGPSTASQTAWALLALLGAEETESAAVRRGVAYLIETQSPDGQWEEAHFTGTGFPRDFMLKYHYYRNYWPLWALGRYRRLREGNPIHLPGNDPWS